MSVYFLFEFFFHGTLCDSPPSHTKSESERPSEQSNSKFMCLRMCVRCSISMDEKEFSPVSNRQINEDKSILQFDEIYQAKVKQLSSITTCVCWTNKITNQFECVCVCVWDRKCLNLNLHYWMPENYSKQHISHSYWHYVSNYAIHSHKFSTEKKKRIEIFLQWKIKKKTLCELFMVDCVLKKQSHWNFLSLNIMKARTNRLFLLRGFFTVSAFFNAFQLCTRM